MFPLYGKSASSRRAVRRCGRAGRNRFLLRVGELETARVGRSKRQHCGLGGTSCQGEGTAMGLITPSTRTVAAQVRKKWPTERTKERPLRRSNQAPTRLQLEKSTVRLARGSVERERGSKGGQGLPERIDRAAQPGGDRTEPKALFVQFATRWRARFGADRVASDVASLLMSA
jgi:hypothetical protein